MVDQEHVIRNLKNVYDPEIPINIYDLGLIYKVEIQEPVVKIQMTLTSQGCPSAQQLPHMVRSAVSAIPGVKEVEVQLVWDPPWNSSMISPEGKKILHLEDQ